MKRRFYAERLLTAAGLCWVCYSDGGGGARRIECVFIGEGAEARAQGYATMLESIPCP